MGNGDSRRGAVPLPLLIVILVAILALIYWLNQRSNAREAAQAAVAEQMAADSAAAAAAAAEAAAAATVVTGEILQTDPSPYTGQKIRVEGMYVTGTLGTQGFWLELPNKNPFLVSFSESARAQGITVVFGQTVTLTGTIVAMGDSVLNAWSTAMTIGEGDRLAAEYATHFLEAEGIEVVTGGAGQTGGEG